MYDLEPTGGSEIHPIVAKVMGVIEKNSHFLLEQGHWGVKLPGGACKVCAVGALVWDKMESEYPGVEFDQTWIATRSNRLMSDPFYLGISDGFEGGPGATGSSGELYRLECGYDADSVDPTYDVELYEKNKTKRHELLGEKYVEGFKLGQEIYARAQMRSAVKV